MASNPPHDTPPAGTEFDPAGSLDQGGVSFEPDTKGTSVSNRGAMLTGAAQTLKEEAGKLGQTGIDRAKAYAVDGKDRAGGALDEFARLMTDAAGSVDEKLGAQYGDYARSAAGSLSGFADNLRNKDIDELLADARELVKKSPAVAIGTAAAVGFVLARLVKSGLDADQARPDDQRRG